MVRKTRRLSSEDVARVLSKGRSVSGTLVRIKWLPRTTGAVSRFAVVVSKKVAKTAVERNLLRRRCFELIAKAKKPTENIDAILFIQAKASFSALSTAIYEGLGRI